MLMQRIMTAVVLAALLLAALLAPSVWPFPVLTLVLIALAGWEWGRLNGLGFGAAAGLGAGLATLCVAALWAGVNLAWPSFGRWPWLIASLWVLGGAWALHRGPQAWPQVHRAWRLALGLLVLWAAWLALVIAWLRGLNFILSTLCVVWVADIAAYAGGRLFGRRKLAPAISPGKTWEGAFSGVAGVWLLALVWLALEQRIFGDQSSLFGAVLERLGWPGLALALVLLCSLGIVGDLVESLVKRAAGVKDSSRLLPGHGGVLDRVDALLPVLPAALALATL